MTEASEYLRILEDLGVDTSGLVANNSRVLRMLDGRKVDGVYFNRNRDGVLYLVVNSNSTVTVDRRLWRTLPDEQVKLKDRGRCNIYPNPGMERQALRGLLASP